MKVFITDSKMFTDELYLIYTQILTGHTFLTTFTCMIFDSHNNAIDLTNKKFSMQK
jgi:hypothetical protein